MEIRKRHLRVAALAVALVTLVAWLWPRNSRPTQTDINSMQRFTQHMTTRCVGRFLIDVPANIRDIKAEYGFHIATVQRTQRTDRSPLKALHELERELDTRAALQRGRLSDRGVNSEPMPDAKLYQPSNDARSILYTSDSTHYNPVMDGYINRPGGIFSFRTNANDENDVREFNDFLVRVAPTLSLRENTSIPTVPGFCIDDGLIAMMPPRGESSAIMWTLPGHPDIRFSLSTSSNADHVRPGHLDEEAETLAYMGDLMSSTKTLRKRRFELAGMSAQEWSVEFTDTPELDFRIEIPGAPNDNARPFITLSMSAGKANMKVKPSISTGEALALWDALIQTMRPRPSAF